MVRDNFKDNIKKEIKYYLQKELTKTLWLNWVVVGFSNIFFHHGLRAAISDGIHRSANIGNEL